jgi:hypothetical protein
MKLTVLDRQSSFDIAVQALGSAEAAFETAILNDLSVTDDLEMGQELLLPASSNREIANYYNNRRLKPATGITDDSLTGRIFDYTFDSSFN